MKAIVIHTDKGAIDLSWEEIPGVFPGPDEVLLDVHATGVNRADLLQARGLYPAPSGDSPILGLEVAGQIKAVGSAVEAWVPGDRVCALALGGGYAEQAVLPQGSADPPARSMVICNGRRRSRSLADGLRQPLHGRIDASR